MDGPKRLFFMRGSFAVLFTGRGDFFLSDSLEIIERFNVFVFFFEILYFECVISFSMWIHLVQDEDQLVISSILPWVECGDQSTRRWVHTAMANGPKR